MLNTDRLGLLGRTIDGRYKINAMIGAGGVGAVYRAEHNRLGRTVAIKVLHHEYAHDPEALQRFFTEARAAATLGHTNIAESIDMGELSDGAPYLVLEFLDGRSLSDAIRYAGRLTVRRALRIARQIACGLEIAHDHDIIHRDLKSDNVFLTHRDDNPEHVKILDFGVARVLDRGPHAATRPGFLVGTPDFMAPEQISDPEHIDRRVDVYAAGVVLHHMLTGQLPYGDDAPLSALLQRIVYDPPTPLPDDLPLDVRHLVADAMARDRDLRIQSMAELRDRIDEVAASVPARPSTRIPLGGPFAAGTKPRVTPPPRPARAGREAAATPARHATPARPSRTSVRRWAALGATMGAALLAVLGLALAPRGDASTEAATAPAAAAAPRAPTVAPRAPTSASTAAIAAPSAPAPSATAAAPSAPAPSATSPSPTPEEQQLASHAPAHPPRPHTHASLRPTLRPSPRPSPRSAAKLVPAAAPAPAPAPASAPLAATPAAPDCSPPYYYEGTKKRFKPSCL